MADSSFYRAVARAYGCYLFSHRDRWHPPADVGDAATADLLVLVHNTMFGDLPAKHTSELPPGCAFTVDRRYAARAAAVVFHIPTLWRLPRVKRRGQLWVGWCMESAENYPQLVDPAVLGRLDLMMTYRLDSDIPTPYVTRGQAADWVIPPDEKNAEHLCAVLISHRDRLSGRVEYVQELMRYINVHSYGRVLNNRTFPGLDEGHSSKQKLLRSYKFALAFENSICRDYVTEKLFQPLMTGCVPVYRGAPNVEDFVPGDHCYINAADFASPRHLAEYLQHLNADETAYAEYFAWKTRPLRAGFLRLLEMARESAGRRLCRLLRSTDLILRHDCSSPALAQKD
jgi:hypothetical protein